MKDRRSHSAIVSWKAQRGGTMLLRIATLSSMLAAVLPAQRPPSRFQLTGCTMECCGYGVWRATTRRVAFATPDTASIQVFVVQPNDSIVADSGVVAMQVPGVLRAEHIGGLRVRPYPDGRAWQTITVPTGDTAYVVFEDAEATDAVIWLRGSLYWSVADFDGFTTVTTLRSTWWARVKNKVDLTGWIADPWRAFVGPGECR
jgi:hypothetical protein